MASQYAERLNKQFAEGRAVRRVRQLEVQIVMLREELAKVRAEQDPRLRAGERVQAVEADNQRLRGQQTIMRGYLEATSHALKRLVDELDRLLERSHV